MLSIELEITDLAFGGAGVGRHEGKAVFVPYTIPGERVRAAVRRQKRNFAEADLEEVLEASPDRQDAPCPYFTLCGGCSYQHLPYERQLEAKSRQVEQVLRRLGGFTEIPLQPMVPSPRPFAYRNRITVHRSGNITGFYDRGGQRLIDIERCLIASDKVNDMLMRLRKTRVHDGNYSLSEPLFSGGFHQTNPHVAALLLEKVDSLCPAGFDLLIDAYCGAGFFAKRLLPKFQRVTGIEWSKASIASALKGAAANESYLQGDVADELGSVLQNADRDRTMLVLDPPATGLEKPVVTRICATPPARLVYVSCNPSTLARDLRSLCAIYKLVSVTPFDMFPQTAEIEVVAELEHARG